MSNKNRHYEGLDDALGNVYVDEPDEGDHAFLEDYPYAVGDENGYVARFVTPQMAFGFRLFLINHRLNTLQNEQ